mgnify:CR=1 FL=1|tara:strand:+ start:7401 stop:8000 length:600 start_codon:yes stop_codon:yes gene_type:complete
MFSFPETEQKLKRKISGYKSSFKKEKAKIGFINDGAGKRYILFSLYFVLDDLLKSQEYFDWYEKEFPDDVGEPIQKLCWALSLQRMKKDREAKYMLGNLMLSNLYMIPHILGEDVAKYDMWHSSNYEHLDYLAYLPEEISESLNVTDFNWMKELYYSFEFRRIRERYIGIYNKLDSNLEHEERMQLLGETYTLLEGLAP